MKYCSTTRITPNHAVPRKPIKTCTHVSDDSCQDNGWSTYPRSTDIRIRLQRPIHPEAVVCTFGRHAVTATAVVGSDWTDDMVGCSRIQTACSKPSNWCLASQQTARGSASLSLRVRRLDAWDLCVLASGGWSRKGPEVVWLPRQQAPRALLWANGENRCDPQHQIQSALPQQCHTQCELAN